MLVMNSKDNVGMVLQDSNPNDVVELILDGRPIGKLIIKDPIDIYHKAALKDIEQDDQIIKYGELIGIATEDIESGHHVHVFNIRSVKV